MLHTSVDLPREIEGHTKFCLV